MKRYLLFSWDKLLHDGGMGDYIGIYENISDAKDEAMVLKIERCNDRWQIVDNESMQIVEENL